MFGLRSLARQSVRFNSNTVTTSETLNSFKKKISQGETPAAANEFLKRSAQIQSYKTDDPLLYAAQHTISDKLAGRSVRVIASNFSKNVSQFNYMVKANNLKSVYFDQRFYTKPNKRRLAKKVALRKKTFQTGIAKLFSVVKDAVRNGY